MIIPKVVLLFVELISFETLFFDNKVTLNRTTEKEKGIDHFIVEWSKDAIEWKPVEAIKGVGNFLFFLRLIYCFYL